MSDQEEMLQRIRQGQAHLQPVEEVTPRVLYERLLFGRKTIQARISVSFIVYPARVFQITCHDAKRCEASRFLS